MKDMDDKLFDKLFDEIFGELFSTGSIIAKKEKGGISVKMEGNYILLISLIEAIIGSMTKDMVKNKVEPTEDKAFSRIITNIILSKSVKKRIYVDTLNNSDEMNDVINKILKMDEKDIDEVLKNLK